jgi:queuine tRNA-ribosyltransferase
MISGMLRTSIKSFKKTPSSIFQSQQYTGSKLYLSSQLQNDEIHLEYPEFSFTIEKQSSTSKARTGLLKTPHGNVHTPNFVFCATKAAMKAVTPDQLRDEGSEIILSNTYHLMLTPGSEIIGKLGGLQKMTGWRGPMLTDSGGYQIFSMGYGSVSNEIKGKRDSENLGWNKTLLSINEEGAVFRSYVDGKIFTLTPERSMEIQRELGADLIVVFDECTPFNVSKEYTAESMHRSHRWGVRCLKHLKSLLEDTQNLHQQHSKVLAPCPAQALYGIVQGGIYEDLRTLSAQFVNNHDFFGMAIGGSLGATKQDMYHIVSYTRNLLRNDRPIHLLGIGGIRDIFHGIRQGIDTFDCVHPSRLGRHGGALVLASHWQEDDGDNNTTNINTHDETGQSNNNNNKYHLLDSNQPRYQAIQERIQKLTKREEDRLRSYQLKLTKVQLQLQAVLSSTDLITTSTSTSSATMSCSEPNSVTTVEHLQQEIQQLEQKVIEVQQRIQSIPNELMEQFHRQQAKQRKQTSKLLGSSGSYSTTVREHIHLTKSCMRDDPRPIDPTCQCYTCRNGFSRAYIHHLFKAKESLAGTLVTLHNIHFMNMLMKDIR